MSLGEGLIALIDFDYIQTVLIHSGIRLAVVGGAFLLCWYYADEYFNRP